ncbi:MAG: hypothetical protein COU65_01495 [Candidatus Pacebacteria bacterium CG10_big_fil_rev_8_21_14_0_10_42_12]|nr:hypothetical protein [Candidatus Paceibacterota bacterium]PIR62788.1 MAG: hypothetical protein COU65_01495 [Candidatus Pacebacteria bacterium CG10_big_fil_rev_8_21_14_0_10_42_12]
MKKTKILGSILGVVLLLGTFQVVSAVDDATDSGKTTQELKKRIEKVVEEKKQEVGEVVAKISTKKRGFVGKIDRVTSETITLETHKGVLIVPLSANVSVTKNGKDVTIDDIAVDEWAITLGVEENGTFEPRFVLVSSKSLRPPEPVVLLGTLKSLTSKELVIVSRSDSEEKSITVTKNALFEDSDGTEIDSEMFEKDLTVLVTGFQDEDGITGTTIRSLAPLSKEK